MDAVIATQLIAAINALNVRLDSNTIAVAALVGVVTKLDSGMYANTLELREIQLSNHQRAKEDRELRLLMAEFIRLVAQKDNEHVRSGADVALGKTGT